MPAHIVFGLSLADAGAFNNANHDIEDVLHLECYLQRVLPSLASSCTAVTDKSLTNKQF